MMSEEDEEDPAQLGPRLGPGMRFLPWQFPTRISSSAIASGAWSPPWRRPAGNGRSPREPNA